jgi:hypothetical protein
LINKLPVIVVRCIGDDRAGNGRIFRAYLDAVAAQNLRLIVNPETVFSRRKRL